MKNKTKEFLFVLKVILMCIIFIILVISFIFALIKFISWWFPFWYNLLNL